MKFHTKQSLKLAKDYYDYINFRARLEKNFSKYNISLKVYETGIRMNIPFFFNCYNDGEKLTYDLDNPRALYLWKKRKNQSITYI